MYGVYNIVCTVHGKSGKICVCACNDDMLITYAIEAKEFITFSIAGANFNEPGMAYLRFCKLIGDTGKPQTNLHQHPTMQIYVSKYSMQH